MKTIKMPVNIGEVVAKVCLFEGRVNCVLSALDSIERLTQYPNHLPIAGALFEDIGGESKWFIFYVEDCMSPPMFLIRCDTFEGAYEAFCDEFSDQIKIEDEDLKDYGENYQLSASGVPIDTESVQGFEVKLTQVIC